MDIRFSTACGAPLLIALAACATAGAVPLGETFSLAVGESAAIDGEDLRLTFDGVSRDNRCPKDVQCIVAGAATVVLIDGEGRELTVDVPPGGDAGVELDGYRITVVSVDPQTVSTRRIEPDDYVVTVVVKRSPPAP